MIGMSGAVTTRPSGEHEVTLQWRSCCAIFRFIQPQKGSLLDKHSVQLLYCVQFSTGILAT
jgi:hypothetical protein